MRPSKIKRTHTHITANAAYNAAAISSVFFAAAKSFLLAKTSSGVGLAFTLQQ
jgi:hypothetical protein